MYDVSLGGNQIPEKKKRKKKVTYNLHIRVAQSAVLTVLLRLLTLHDKDNGTNIAFSYNYRASRKRDGIHAIDNLPDLRKFQILHKIVVQYGSLDQLARS